MLTRQQENTYRFICDFIADHGHSPTLVEIAKGLGITSRGTVHRYVQALVDEGLVTHHSGRHRGIEPVMTMPPPLSLAMAGTIAAGLPIEAIADIERIDLAEMFLGEGRYALRVKGDSMIEAGILDGDTVIVQSAQRASDGDIVVALIDNEAATLKRIKHHKGGKVELIAANPSIEPMVYPSKRVHIQGILVGSMRTYS